MNILDRLEQLSLQPPLSLQHSSVTQRTNYNSQMLVERAVKLYTSCRTSRMTPGISLYLSSILSRMFHAVAMLCTGYDIPVSALPTSQIPTGSNQPPHQFDVDALERSFVAILGATCGLYSLVRRDLGGTEYYKQQVYRRAICEVWEELLGLVRLVRLDMATILERPVEEDQETLSQQMESL